MKWIRGGRKKRGRRDCEDCDLDDEFIFGLHVKTKRCILKSITFCDRRDYKSVNLKARLRIRESYGHFERENADESSLSRTFRKQIDALARKRRGHAQVVRDPAEGGCIGVADVRTFRNFPLPAAGSNVCCLPLKSVSLASLAPLGFFTRASGR